MCFNFYAGTMFYHFEVIYSRMNKILYVIFVWLLVHVLPLNGQEMSAPSIYSAKISIPGAIYGLPVMNLGDRTGLMLSFDDLTTDARYFRYKLQHCDRNWKPSDLSEIEYLEGINDQLIEDYSFSNQTHVDYVHYEVRFPGNGIKPKVSGNYLITVYDENTDEVVLVRKFMVVDKKVFASAKLQRPSRVSQMRTHQALELTVNYKDFPMSNPVQDVSVTILQNGIWQRSISDIRPRNVFGDVIEFDWRGKIVFPGGMDFRSLDLRNLGYRSFGIKEITEYKDGYVVVKEIEKSRAGRSYFLERDQNGNFMIDNERSFSGKASTTSEYAEVDFRVQSNGDLGNERVFVSGGFTNYVPDPRFELKYNTTEGYYEGTVLMKQGRYDYLYTVSDGASKTLDFNVLEGSSNETENFYLLLTYYRPFGSRYDQLISADITNLGG